MMDSPHQSSTCIVTVVDENYLPGFQCLLHSVRTVGKLDRIPIVAILRDPALAQHRYLKQVDLIVLPNEEENESFAIIAKNGGIAETFLKLLAFKNFGFDRNIFLDCDLLCLNDARPLLNIGTDFAAVASIMQDLEIDSSTALSRAETLGTLEYEALLFGNGAHWHGWKINSGVMVLRPDDLLAGRLMEYAKSRAFRHDQHCINEFWRSNMGFPRIEYLPQRFNLVRHVFDSLGQTSFRRAIPRTIFLHYTGPKPWLESKLQTKSFGTDLWKSEYVRADRITNCESER